MQEPRDAVADDAAENDPRSDVAALLDAAVKTKDRGTAGAPCPRICGGAIQCGDDQAAHVKGHTDQKSSRATCSDETSPEDVGVPEAMRCICATMRSVCAAPITASLRRSSTAFCRKRSSRYCPLAWT